jgi:hypothetical protein
MSDAAIHVDATHSALQFVLSGCTPVASIDGGQPFAIRWNQPTPVGVAAGAHRVTVWCPYAGSPQMGLASVDVQLAPGQGVLATWAAPGTALGQGTFSLAGAAAPPAAPQQYGQQQYGQQQYSQSPPQYGQQQAAPSAGWHPDPAGRYAHRWWDGTRWSDQVSDGANVGPDPAGAP